MARLPVASRLVPVAVGPVHEAVRVAPAVRAPERAASRRTKRGFYAACS